MSDEQKQQKQGVTEDAVMPVESAPKAAVATTALSDVKPGMTVRVHQRITDVTKDGKERERIQVFEGLVLGKHGGTTSGATVTIRKISDGIGVEKIFPVSLPSIEKVEIVKQAQLRRAKAFFLRDPRKVKQLKEVSVRA